MKKIKYTPDAADKLRALKSAISGEYGGDKAKKIIKSITVLGLRFLSFPTSSILLIYDSYIKNLHEIKVEITTVTTHHGGALAK